MTNSIKNICVFCGSSYGAAPIYKNAAQQLGKLMATSGIRLIYGGGHVGLMGAIADSVLQHGGQVTGIIPRFLEEKEVAHTALTELIITHSMHERKQLMAEKADAFIAMPGGIGTLEELAEIMTWVQLELIRKPIGILNVDGYFNGLVAMLNTMVDEGFLKSETKNTFLHDTEAQSLLTSLQSFTFPEYSIWSELDRS